MYLSHYQRLKLGGIFECGSQNKGHGNRRIGGRLFSLRIRIFECISPFYLLHMNPAAFITISPDIQSGTPVFAGTRVPVKNLFDYLRGGDTLAEFLHDFPSVSREQVDVLLQMMETILTLNPVGPYEKNAA